MRLWSIHPRYLDSRGLVALWREGLLAQKGLLGETKGYRHHPQLLRFRESGRPVEAIASYLRKVADEGDARGYKFDRSRIAGKGFAGKIAVTSGQIKYEFAHLLEKLRERDMDLYARFYKIGRVEAHPLFKKISGGVEGWEVIKPG